MKHFFLITLLSAAAWGSSVTNVSATEYVDVNVTVVANNEILLDSTEYISTDGCTVKSADAIEYTIEGAKAVCALYSASQAAGIPLSLTDYGFGLFIAGIGDVETNADLDWYWLYYINGEYPVGVSDQTVQSGDDLVFTYGYWTAAGAPLVLELSDMQVVTDEFVYARVFKNENDGKGYVPAEGATVFVNDWQYTTNEKGKVKFAIPKKGKKSVHAQLEGYTRTTPVDVRIYTRHTKKAALSLKQRKKMAQRGLEFLAKKSVARTIAQSASLQDWQIVARVALGKQPGSFLSTATAYNAQASGMRTEVARNVLALSASEKMNTAREKASQLVKMQNVCEDSFINDELYTVLALRSAAKKDASYRGAIKKNVRCALQQQKKSGGMPLTLSGTPDMDTTAVFVQMLASIEKPKQVGLKKKTVAAAKKKALTYLKKKQNPDGGWGYMYNEPSNSSSTAMVLMAFASAEKDAARITENKRNGFHFLKRTQKKKGAFAYDTLGTASVEEMNTLFASIALVGKYLPVQKK